MISRFIKYFIPVAALLAAGAQAKADTLSDARASGTIRVCVATMGMKPFVWQDASGAYTGAEADLTKEMLKRMGIKSYIYVQTEWSTLIPALKSHRCDLIISGLAKTEERIQGGGITMSDPYLMIYDVLIVKNGSPITSVNDLKGKTIASVLGTVDSMVAHELVDEGKVASVEDFNTFAEPFMALKNGQVAAVLIDQLTYSGFKQSMGDMHTVGGPLLYIAKPQWAAAQAKANYKLGAVAIGVRISDPDLLAAVNKALESMDADGTRQAILTKYGIWDNLQTTQAMMK